MRHIQQCTGCISLNSHVLGLGQLGQWTQCSGLGYLRFVILMSSQVCDAANSVTLNFDILGIHLFDQGYQATFLDNLDLVLGVDSQVAKCSTGCSLYLDIIVLKEG